MMMRKSWEEAMDERRWTKKDKFDRKYRKIRTSTAGPFCRPPS
jgi:hypothetical protein